MVLLHSRPETSEVPLLSLVVQLYIYLIDCTARIPLDQRYLDKAYSKSSDQSFKVDPQVPHVLPIQTSSVSSEAQTKRLKILENVVEMLWVALKAAEGELKEGGRFLTGQMSVDTISETSDSHLELADQLKRLRNIAKEDLAKAGATGVTKKWKNRFRHATYIHDHSGIVLIHHSSNDGYNGRQLSTDFNDRENEGFASGGVPITEP